MGEGDDSRKEVDSPQQHGIQPSLRLRQGPCVQTVCCYFLLVMCFWFMTLQLQLFLFFFFCLYGFRLSIDASCVGLRPLFPYLSWFHFRFLSLYVHLYLRFSLTPTLDVSLFVNII